MSSLPGGYLVRCDGKCRLLPNPPFPEQHQDDAIFSDGLNIRERAGNEPASCKAFHGIGGKKENPGALAGATGAISKILSGNNALKSYAEIMAWEGGHVHA